MKTGIWVFAVPVATDQSLNDTNLGVIVAQVLAIEEPDLKAAPSAETDAKLGTLDAALFEISGVRKTGGDWKGRMLAAVQQDSFLMVMYGSSAAAAWVPAVQALIPQLPSP